MSDAMPRAPENKAADFVPSSGDVVDAYDQFMRAFESYRDVNDERLSEIESRITADPLTEEKLARIDAVLDRHKSVLDQMVLKSRRPALGGDPERFSLGARERKSAFEVYVRRRDATALTRLDAKSMSVGSNSDGGYLVPDETEREIGTRLIQSSPIRAIAGIRTISANVYKKPFATTGFSTGWVGETDARTQTNTPNLAELEFPAMELYAMPAATQTLLDDNAVDLDQWIAQEVETAFATQEGAAFVNGDGDKKPKGFLNATKVAEASWSWGNLGYIATGVSGDFAATDPADELVDLVYALKAGYRQNARFVMNRRTQASVRKLKDGDGRYLWMPPAEAGGDATLLGFPVTEAEDMPNIAANSFSLAFGDFRRGYLVVDRLGVRVLRDPYSAKPYVLFYTTKRVGGGVQDFDAIKLLKFGVS
ncbi:phage major capsid protein [Flaviflagellibacter deserti]|uniref:Phage major capsid protein n=1 Tax=Flaviflagellibacter deserti TaxID=2267266 RepID=A0ABV9Z4N4_9HYPH